MKPLRAILGWTPVLWLSLVGCRLDDGRPPLAGASPDAGAPTTDAAFDADDARSGARCLVVAAAEFGADGALGMIDLATLEARVELTRTHHDALVRVVGDEVYVVNREGADTIQKVDRTEGLRTLWERSVGAGSNPWDLIDLGDGRALVPLYNRGEVAVVRVDGAEPFVESTHALPLPPEADGRHEIAAGVVWNDLVVVLSQGLESYPRCGPEGRGSLVALDRATLEPRPHFEGEPVLWLDGCNPSQLVLRPDGELLVGLAGAHRGMLGSLPGEDDGGIERVDLVQGRSLGWLTTESDWGGRDLVRMAEASGGDLWLSLADDDFDIHVYRATRSDEGDALVLADEATHTSEGTFALLEAGGWLFIADRTWGRAGVVVVDAASGAHRARIEMAHPPYDLAVVRVEGDRCW